MHTIFSIISFLFITARNSSCGKVMFSQASADHSVHRGGVGISGPRSLPGRGGRVGVPEGSRRGRYPRGAGIPGGRYMGGSRYPGYWVGVQGG